MELTGSSVFDYIHPADHVEMAERLGIKPHLRTEAGCQTAQESASSSASTSSLAGTPEPGNLLISEFFVCLLLFTHYFQSDMLCTCGIYVRLYTLLSFLPQPPPVRYHPEMNQQSEVSLSG